MVAQTRQCPLGNFSLPRGVFFILATLHCNGWFGVACQAPLAQAGKTIPRTCQVPDAFCRMSGVTETGGSQRPGWGCTGRARRGGGLLHTNPKRRMFAVYSGADRGAADYLVWHNTASRSTEPVHSTTGMDTRRAILQVFCGNDNIDKESDVCHQMSFNVSLSQHDSIVSTGTSTRLPQLTSCEDGGWQAPGCWSSPRPQLGPNTHICRSSPALEFWK